MRIEYFMVGDLVKDEEVVTKLDNLDFIDDRKEFSPIAITEEILLKSGFQKTREWMSEDKDYTYYHSNTTNDNFYNLYIKHLRNNVFFIRAETFYYINAKGKEYSRIFTGDIWWVHEIQHILRLLNIDKEIIL